MGDLSKNFDYKEFECPCCGASGTVQDGMGVIGELVRHFNGDKITTINSGYRCYNHNERVQMDADEHYIPGTSQSKHMEGIAGDFKVDNPSMVAMRLDKLFPDQLGIGVYSSWIHVDLRQEKARW